VIGENLRPIKLKLETFLHIPEGKMGQSARDEILKKLKAAPKKAIGPRPDRPPQRELSLTKEELLERFTKNLVEETGVVHRVPDSQAALDKLTEIAKAEGLKKVMVSTDDVVAPLDLPAWGKKNGVQVMTPKDFADRDSFRDAVFDQAQAGITGADFAVAESGTIGLIHNKDQARLISLAPILHIAIIPVERMFPVYEPVIEKVFGKNVGAHGGAPAEKTPLPSQFVFITGPSMTGDIQGALFKGMHGPRRLIAILVG
jgi:L-lactate dehydrogenase complex protein LldG